MDTKPDQIADALEGHCPVETGDGTLTYRLAMGESAYREIIRCLRAAAFAERTRVERVTPRR